MPFSYKTRGMSSPGGKPRVFFCCHPMDFEKFFEPVSEDILKKQNCAIWYDPENGPLTEESRMDLAEMQLFVIPITAKLLTTPNPAMDELFPFAEENHIPVLPLMQEKGLEQVFNRKFGDLQFLDKNAKDATAISFDEKLEKYLVSVLVGDELAEKVRAAFDAYIFLSYRKKDRKYANELMRLIHQNDFCRDIAIWYDEYLVPGENFNDAIADALKKCDIFTLAVTPNLVNEVNYVMTTEYPAVRKTDKPILPAEVVPTDREQMKEKYEGLPECVDAHDEAGLGAALMDTLQQIAKKENDRNPQHNFFIGLAYLGGVDVEVDHDRALTLITGAAEAGLAEAVKKLVEMYDTGNGVPRDYQMAIQWQERLVERCEKAYQESGTEEDGTEAARELLRLMSFWQKVSRLDKSREINRRAIQFAEKLQETYPSGEVRRLLATFYSILCQLCWMMDGSYGEEAREACKKTLEISYAIADTLEKDDPQYTLIVGNIASGITNLGNIEEQNKHYEQAAKHYQRALELHQMLVESGEDYKSRLSSDYNNMGDVCSALGKMEEAEEYYRKALEIDIEIARETEEADDRANVADRYCGQGRFRMNQGKLAEAEDCYREAIKIAGELVAEDAGVPMYRYRLGCGYLELGRICRNQMRYTEAKEFFGRAMEEMATVVEETGATHFRSLTSQIYRNLGYVCEKLEETSEANDCYSKALEIDEALVKEFGRVDHSRALITDYDLLGDFCMAQGKSGEAREYYEEARYISELLAKELETAEAYRKLAKACSKLEDWEKAKDAWFKVGNLLNEQVEKTEDPAVRREWCECYEALGKAYDKLKDYGMAATCYDEAADGREILMEKEGTVEAWFDLALDYFDIIACFTKDRNRPMVAWYGERALPFVRELAQETGAPVHRLLCADIGYLFADVKTGEEREEILKESLQILEELSEEYPENERYTDSRDMVWKALYG